MPDKKTFQCNVNEAMGLTVERPHRFVDPFTLTIGGIGSNRGNMPELKVTLDQGMATNLIRFLQGHH